MTDWQISEIYGYILRPGLQFENSNLAECDIDKDKLGRYLEILGRWDFRGIGENVNGSLFSQCPKCFSVAGVCGCPETSGRVQ